jgi:N-acetylneuraminate synthase/N,N'-diacetyllegionaminate synthase
MGDTVSIGARAVGNGEPVLVIAEAGVNHNGDPGLALRLVDEAAAAGADAVKFQTFSAERVAAASAPKAGYQLETTDPAESQLEMLRGLELTRDAHEPLIRRCAELGILFLSSAFDDESVALLDELDVPAIKVGSGELTNVFLLERIAATGRPVILSTGMADLDEVGSALRTLDGSDVVLLHCVSNYPASPDDANLRAMATLRDAFQVAVGFSDHTTGIETSLAAVALGACAIEKHFTLDAGLPGPDHRASLEPDAFRAFVDGVRIVSSTLGDGTKQPAESELENRRLVRRSLVAARALPAGTTLEPGMVRALRPGTGIAPTDREAVLGRVLVRELAEDEPLSWDDLA